MMESDDTFLFSSPVFYRLVAQSPPIFPFFSFSAFFYLYSVFFFFYSLLQTEMPTKAPGQGRSSTRSDAEESEIGHSSARRRVHRRSREVSVLCCSQFPFTLYSLRS